MTGASTGLERLITANIFHLYEKNCTKAISTAGRKTQVQGHAAVDDQAESRYVVGEIKPHSRPADVFGG